MNKTIRKLVVLGLTSISALALTSCDNSSMKKKDHKVMKKSEPVTDHHPKENKEVYKKGQGEPRMKQHSDEMHKKNDYKSEPRYPKHHNSETPKKESM